ncbi:MAG TPA: hypothetical protein VNP96_12510 [Solirubrobacterales bacterium]|nr:hypothetical protein [Solirubrobacterales bacterium]
MICHRPSTASTNFSQSGPTSHLSYVLAVRALAPPALVAPGPDVDAFTGGVVLAISAGFIILVALGGLAIVRRILGS